VNLVAAPPSTDLIRAQETVALTQPIQIAAPYLVFMGDVTHKNFAKTALGLRDWCPERCLGQLRLHPDTFDIGLPDMTIGQAVAAGARTLVVGIAPPGGQLSPDWIHVLKAALEGGMDIAAGLHSRLSSIAVLADTSAKMGRRLIDVRIPPQDIPLGTGRKRSGNRLLTVGTDCAVGKKYTALAIAAEMSRRDIKTDFRASGQTGILIAGSGMPIDATISDFVAGAAEILSPDNDEDHWDIVEGQGSLFHPSYAGVSLGLLHGSQPDAIVLCHEAGRDRITFREQFAIPSLEECIAHNLACGRLTNPAIRCVGVSVNTSSMDDAARTSYLAALQTRLNLPCVDPIRTGVGSVVDHLLATGQSA